MARGGGEGRVANIFQVAKEAQVSITTVSHVFSGKRPVSDGTRRRVLDVARSLRYHPRRHSRLLLDGQTMTLAVQLPRIGAEIVFNPYFSSLLPAMSRAAVAHGYALVLVPPEPSLEAFIEPLVGRRAIDAAILIDQEPKDPFAVALEAEGIPFVSLGRIRGLRPHPRVDQDFTAALLAVLAHLADQGYQRPSLLTVAKPMSTIAGIQETFKSISRGGTVQVAMDFSDSAAAEAAAELLLGRHRTDSVICLTERQAVGVYRAASYLGFKVPEDLGVVSLGDGAVAQGMSPPLTSVQLFPDRSGEELVELAHRLLSGDQADEVILVPTQLVVRASTRAAPGAEACPESALADRLPAVS